MKQIKIFFSIAILIIFSSCQKYLDVVPDSVATIENAFTLRSSAEKFLFTCYSYMPQHGHHQYNPGFATGDEVWYMDPPMDVGNPPHAHNIAKGLQSSSNPLLNFWSGSNGGEKLYTGLRDCNIFLENIHKVKELNEYERERWIAEVKFLKAYYHFYLMRMYGPIPLVIENLPISSGPEKVQVARVSVDECVDYIVELLDEAAANEFLPEKIVGTENIELGRITKAIVLALKAKVLVTAASPLFNGNADFSNLKSPQGNSLINPVYDVKKWERAASACKDAIDFCHANGYALWRFPGAFGYKLTPEAQIELDIRTAITEKMDNTEVIWANPNSRANDIQRFSMPLIAVGASTSGPKGIIAPPIKMAEMFYSKNGVPITEDVTWDYSTKYDLKKGTSSEKYYIKEGEETVKLHFDREPRFYANIGFDRGIWFGNWVNNYNADTNNIHFVRARKGETAARQGISNYSISGYWVKKLVNIATSCATDGNMTSNMVQYPWPEFRLADLYLMYSEVLNELNGYSSETTYWINLVRARAGLKSVEESWSNFSKNGTKYQTKEGLREIIQQERSIELAFEGHRYWDLKRWKTAHIELNNPIKGWDITQESAAAFYREVLLYDQKFRMRDYFWPIEIGELQINRSLVQNPGW